jgi:hypothetical protein
MFGDIITEISYGQNQYVRLSGRGHAIGSIGLSRLKSYKLSRDTGNTDVHLV